MKQDNEFIKHNYETIMYFMRDFPAENELITIHIQSTIAQFLRNFRTELQKRGDGKGFVSSLDIIEAEVMELRQCIIHLEQLKEIQLQGAVIQ